jgi:hypothetical protein
MKKTRYNITPFYFIIANITGKSITIAATDGSVKTVTKSRIILLKSNDNMTIDKRSNLHHNLIQPIIKSFG